MPPNHGAVCEYSPVEKNSRVDDCMTEECFRQSLEKGTIVSGRTLEELLDRLDVDKKQALASIARYNELARRGRDEDFNKPAKRMFPIEKGPFYGGLESDEECRVYDEQGEVMPGLYAAGNVQGCIYAGEYPICVRGMSHSICMFYGYTAGKNAVSGV